MRSFPEAHEQLTPQSVVGSDRISNSSEILWLSLLLEKNEEDLIKNEGARVQTTFLPIITLWELSVAVETRVLI